nr:hypothetical protein [Tanacetum cinerariifolium]
MNTNQAQQKALDDALDAPAECLEFRKCNMRLDINIKPKEATFQVVLDALALTPFYQAFIITAKVPSIYMRRERNHSPRKRHGNWGTKDEIQGPPPLEKIDDEESMDEEEDDEVTKELYNDVNVNLRNEDTKMTNVDQANNEIASLMDTTTHYATTISEITSSFTTPTPPPPPFFKPLSVSNLEKDIPEMKQVDQYAKALSFIPAIVDCYIDNKLGEAINKASQAHNYDYREDAQAKKREYIKLVDSTVRTIIKEEGNTQPSNSFSSDFRCCNSHY